MLPFDKSARMLEYSFLLILNFLLCAFPTPLVMPMPKILMKLASGVSVKAAVVSSITMPHLHANLYSKMEEVLLKNLLRNTDPVAYLGSLINVDLFCLYHLLSDLSFLSSCWYDWGRSP